jgi:hypothetical protein
MKDIIWTLIVVWLIYRLVDVFRAATAKRTSSTRSENQQNNPQYTTRQTTSNHDADIKNAVRKHLNNEGEYVDFEEVK